MDVVIEVIGKFTLTVEDVAHPTHGVNRVKKYLRDSTFQVIQRPGFQCYMPPSPITIQFDENDLARAIDEDNVVTPEMWFDRGEMDQIHQAMRSSGIDIQTRDKIGRLMEENNPL